LDPGEERLEEGVRVPDVAARVLVVAQALEDQVVLALRII
jgi:hypothetical protein